MATFGPLLLLVAVFLVSPVGGGYIRVLEIDPVTQGGCPTGLTVAYGVGSVKLCKRGAFPMSAIANNVSHYILTAANLKGLGVYTSINATMKLYQKGSTDAFATGFRTSALDSSNYVDGISFTRGSPRAHVFTIALGQSYDLDLGTTGMCPCTPQTLSLACSSSATPAPAFIGSDFACDSGNLGGIGTAWEPREVLLSFAKATPETADDVEVRIMCDQPNSNEDLGIAQMQVDIFEAEDNEPPDMTLFGNDTMYLEMGNAWKDPGVACQDNIDGTITPSLSWSPLPISSLTLGDFYLTYTCEDTRQNSASLTRKISVRDTEAPRITVRAGSKQCVLVGDPYVEYGAECVDNMDGTFEGSITGGDVDPDVPGVYNRSYACIDTSGNAATGSLTVVVLDEGPLGGTWVQRWAAQTALDGSYTTAGVKTVLKNVNTATDLRIHWNVNFEFWSEGCRYIKVLEGSGIDAPVVREFEDITFGAAAVSGMELILRQQHTMVKKYNDVWPLCQNLGACFTGLYLGAAKERCFASAECTGFSFSQASMDGGRGDGCLKACIIEDENGYGTSAHTLGPHGYWEKQPAAYPFLASGLKDLTSYSVVIDEHLTQAVGGGTAAHRNARHVLGFATGDYTGPKVIATQPAHGELDWPLSQRVTLTFSELVRGTGTGSLYVTRVNDSFTETIWCNGTASPSGVTMTVSGENASVVGIEGWSGWGGCRDYQVSADAGCFTDTSVNENPSAAVAAFQFVTSCVEALSPASGAVGVPIDSPIALTFADAVQVGVGEIILQPEGEPALTLNAQDYPTVYTEGAVLTIDLACSTRTCILMKSNTTPAGPLGMCAGRDVQKCKGKVHRVSVGQGALRFADHNWGEDSLLVNSTDVLPPQFTGSAAYAFTLAPADETPPTFLSVQAHATSENSIDVKVWLSETGTVYCAALGGRGGDTCTSLTVINDTSGFCDVASRDDCSNCAPPSYGCVDSSTIWVDDGCTGLFLLEGEEELQCHSRVEDTSNYDGGVHSILSLGHRHACAIRKSVSSPTVTCWGRSDYIDPSTGQPPAGSFVAVSAGETHSCGVLKASGDIVCWGIDLYGETSGPSLVNASSFFSVTSGYAFSCGLRTDNKEAECWGLDDVGQASPPAGVAFLAISAGNRHVCGVRQDDHHVQCWGWDANGQSSPPAGVAFMALSPAGAKLPEGTISAGWYHTCAIREDSGEVQCWGKNSDGQSSAPNDGVAFVEVAAGRAHTCGVHRTLVGVAHVVNGTVRCWGLNDLGQASVPPGLTVRAISAGDDFTCALDLESGLATCWGKNDYGQVTPPASEVFGYPDVYEKQVCELNIHPSIDRIREVGKASARGTSATIQYDIEWGYGEAVLSLEGLLAQRQYDVYCFAEDDEVPTPNVVSQTQMFATQRLVTTLDETPPSIHIVEATASGQGAITMTVQLNEPGTVYCGVVMDRELPPTSFELVRQGRRGTTDSGHLTSVTLDGLPVDTEFDAYCTARDQAGLHADSYRLDNWPTQQAVKQTKMDIHTRYDLSPPILVSTSPHDTDMVNCVPDGVVPGCMTTVTLWFDEDVFAGAGNVSFVCVSNIGQCQDVIAPMDNEAFDGGTWFIENRRVVFDFTSPLVDASTFKVVFADSALTDDRGNAFHMDVSCEPWFDPSWQPHLGPCTPAYSFRTPS